VREQRVAERARAERGGTGVTVETPAASAAIRGTDWTMTVDASGRTSLVVLEGLVELSNAFGSVRVAEGATDLTAISRVAGHRYAILARIQRAARAERRGVWRAPSSESRMLLSFSVSLAVARTIFPSLNSNSMLSNTVPW
jgi:hypothetical protein